MLMLAFACLINSPSLHLPFSGASDCPVGSFFAPVILDLGVAGLYMCEFGRILVRKPVNLSQLSYSAHAVPMHEILKSIFS